MFVLKDEAGVVFEVTNELKRDSYGNYITDNGSRTFAEYIVATVEETDITPDNWFEINGTFYEMKEQEIFLLNEIEKTKNELATTQEALDAMLMGGV